LRAVENDFDGTRMTIPRARDATGQGGDGGAFVRVHAGRGQATFCAGAHRTWSGSLHQRAGAVHAQDADGRWSRRCEDGESRKSAAHAQDGDGQWNRRCEDGGARKRCEDGGARRIIGSKQGRTIWGSMDTVAWSMMDAAAVGSSAGP